MKRKTVNLLRENICQYQSDEDDMPTELGGGRAPSFDEEAINLGGGGYGGGARGPSLDDYGSTDLASSTFADRMDETLLDIPETGLLGLLWVVEGDQTGRIYKIHDGDVVGRRSGALILDDPKVSTPHCRFREDKDGYVLWDCGSKNGTLVNNKRITCATKLEENDRVKIGDVVFSLKTLK
jgi:hypothetical protein